MTLLRIVFVVLGLLIVGVWLTPMRWALSLLPLEQNGVRVESVRGSVWNASLSGVWVNANDLGNVDLRLSPSSLLSGKPELSFKSDIGVSGVASPASGGLHLRNLAGRIALSRLQTTAPPEAELLLGEVALELGSGGCRTASGRVQVEGLDERVQASGGPPGPYVGMLRCVDGEVLVDVSTPEGVAGPTISLGRPGRTSTP